MSDTPPNLPNVKTLWFIVDKCITITVMAIVIWGLWAWVEKRDTQRDEQINKLETAVSECLQNKQDRIEAGVQEILRRMPDK